MMTRNRGPYYLTSLFLFMAGFAFIHMYHVSTLFENDRHFSHLSNLEREMTFRTEMGFYYYYYKQVVSAPSLKEALGTLMHDNRIEYPNAVNALERFNIYPELIIGVLYRIFDQVTKYYNIPTKQCWEVNRGPSISPVNSCEGLGDPMYFYLAFVWYFAGFSISMLFIYAAFLSESFSGGILAALGFFFNHGHCTRVQWSPPLRESFGYPFCLLQMAIVSYCLKNYSSNLSSFHRRFMALFIMLGTTISLVSWQFSQFVIATQTVAVLLIFCLGIIEKKTVIIIVISQLIGLFSASVFLLENVFLFQSILFSLLLATTLVVVLFRECRIQYPTYKGILILTAVTGITFALKSKIGEIYGEQDAHIFDLLRSKLTNFKNFHTMLYTCSPEFDYLPFSTIYELTITGLIPIMAAVICLLLFKWRRGLMLWSKESNKWQKSIEPEVAYNLLQLAAFTVMALFIMRLKLFWTPHLCIMSSLIMSHKYLPSISKYRHPLLVLLIGIMSYQGLNNLMRQRNIIGEYSNIPFEEVLTWIDSETREVDVFAGPMSIMANVLLSTGRSIVNHPHYENQGMRDRTLKVYSVFSRQSPEQVYSTLVDMGVDYLILEETWCYMRSRENCSMVELWDLIDFDNRNNEPLCPKLFAGNPTPFFRVFTNEVFVILSVKARQFIEITAPKQFQI